MKNIKPTYSFAFIVLLVITSCTSRKENPNSKAILTNSIVAEISLEKEIRRDKRMIYDSLFEVVDYIVPELTDESVIGKYDKMIVNDKYLFILENNASNRSVFVFDPNGKYLSKVNSPGQGPGEYFSINDFYYDDRNNLIGVLNQSQILRYELDGTFRDKINLRKYMLSEIAYSNGLLYGYTIRRCGAEKCYSVIVFDETFNPIYEDYPLRNDINSFPLSGGKRFLSASNGNVYFNAVNNDTIYTIHNDRMEAYAVIDFGEFKIPDKYFSELVDAGENAIYRMHALHGSKYALYGLRDLKVSDQYLYINFHKDNKMWHSFYSLKTKQNKTSGSFGWSSGYAFPMSFEGIQAVYKDRFYFAIDAQFVDYVKQVDEIEEVFNLPDNNHRKIRYDKVVKDYHPDSNTPIVVFTVKDF